MSPSVFAQALKFMNAAQIPIVTISGGEPMLYWSDLKKGLANNPIRTITVCTNGFWGVDKTSRKSILMELPKYGISELEISTDVYHQVFVNLEDSIIPIIDEAQEIGLKVTVIVCMTHPVEVINTVNLLQKHLSVPSCLELRSISNFGSAANNLDIIPHTKGQVEQAVYMQTGWLSMHYTHGRCVPLLRTTNGFQNKGLLFGQYYIR